jgi:hypothetical protein
MNRQQSTSISGKHGPENARGAGVPARDVIFKAMSLVAWRNSTSFDSAGRLWKAATAT